MTLFTVTWKETTLGNGASVPVKNTGALCELPEVDRDEFELPPPQPANAAATVQAANV
ncbi:MAG: hypothetical protein ACYCPM_07435 [Acidobacteriaceae bacterium]